MPFLAFIVLAGVVDPEVITGGDTPLER